MAMKCSNCKKGIMYGHNVSHSKRRTPRKFKPNLHVASIKVDGRSVKMKLCTKCLRLLKKQEAPVAKAIPQTAPIATA